MASPPRILIPQALYHVYTCGTGPSALFRDDGDHLHFNFTLGKSVEMYAWRLFAWVHLTTHVHLLVQTPEPNLHVGMQRTKSCYARHFNQKYERRGALYDARYGYRVIGDAVQFFRTVRYVARNPVEAGLAERASDWHWSSIGPTLRGTPTWPANAADELVARCGGLTALEGLVDGCDDLADVG